MSHFMISAAHKSSGKTTVTLGLCAALTQRGLHIQPFKKGPDYIDPLWLGQAAQQACHNLDFHTMSNTEIRTTFARYHQHADLSIIEGNLSLYDGMDVEGSNSNAALAHLLTAPVILVLNVEGVTRGIVPLILGYQAFDKSIHIAGVILNRAAGQRHEGKLRAAIEHYTDIPILGVIHRHPNLAIVERHLGLMPNNEVDAAQQKIDSIATIIADQVDLDKVIQVADYATKIDFIDIPAIVKPKANIKIGIMRDAAFGFYYASDLKALQQAGAELVFINALQDETLPDIDGLFIGGGFPETQMTALANNQSLKQAIYQAIENNLPVYAECGGLMYLARQLTWHDQQADMVGILPFDTIMHERPQGRGYVKMQETGHHLWGLPNIDDKPATFPAHEFHYSKAVNVPDNLTYAYKVLRGQGINGDYDGVIYKNVLACYVHLRDVDNNRWTQRFVEFVQYVKNS